jgi:hypothetical protein
MNVFFLQFRTSLQKLQVHLQTQTRHNIISLHPGLFSSLLGRTKASRKGKIIRLAMLTHLHHIMVVSPIRYMVIEVGGLPRFFGEIVRTL